MSTAADQTVPQPIVGPLTLRGIDKPRATLVMWVVVALMFACAFPWAQIDTNPKNMLPPESDVRVWNAEVEERFGLHEDTIVVAVRREGGVLSTDSLARLQQLTAEIVALPGIVKGDVTSLYTADNVTAEGDSLRIAPLLASAPASEAQTEVLRKQLFEGPLFVDRLISRDEKTTAIYVPLENGTDGARLANEIRQAALRSFSPEEIYITGDPVARDLFGAEMFKLMGLFAPIAGMLMMILMVWMFRSWWLAGVMMLTAMVSILISMGAAIALGFPIHIMSSMAPVFLMAIATDSIHIFNEFFQRYRPGLNRAEVIRETIQAVSRPVRYTALATALGFAVLLFMKIVPVKVFGGIIVLGTIVLRTLSFSLIPACLMLVPLPTYIGRSRLRRFFGHLLRSAGKRRDFRRLPRGGFPTDHVQQAAGTTSRGRDPLAGVMAAVAAWSVRHSRAILIVGGVLALASIWGSTATVVDNNMVRWFKEGNPVRQADVLLGQQMGGATPASLVIDTGRLDGVKEPAVLAGIEMLQRDLVEQQLVGTTLSVVDYLKRINRVLNGNVDAAEVIPQDPHLVAQYLLAFSMGARPSDLNRVIDYEYQRANVLLQLRSGDAQLMKRLEDRVQSVVRERNLPFKVMAAGPAHFNLVWNEQVLSDMILGFAIALGVVLIVLAADFRSIKWALVAYVPLLLTVAVIIGALGWMGKEVDMPVAVLSCLSLGMAVDFAIHFVTRYRLRCAGTAASCSTDAERDEVLRWVIEWPGKGIIRNALLFAIAFAVMLAAPLTPYITVGAFIVSMMTLSALASVTLLPALIKTFRLR